MTEGRNENVLPLKKNFPIVPLRCLTVLAVVVPCIILCIVKFIDVRGTVQKHVLEIKYNIGVMQSTDF